MNNVKLFEVGRISVYSHHLLVIGILVISFSISVMLRSQPAMHGLELNEADPFFNYRATNFLVNNGLDEYFTWHDDLSWYPVGRDIAKTSQVTLHITAAYLYQAFGTGMTLNEFVILFPVIFGSLTCIIIFALVRLLGGTSAGLFAALFFSVSPIIIMRGSIGWFKSEPLGLFYGLLALYFFLSGLKTKNPSLAASKLIGAGIFLGLGISSWGGIMFFLIPLGIFIVVLPFLRTNNSFLIWSIPVFVAATILVGLLVRETLSFSLGIAGFALIGPTIFLVILIFVQRFSYKVKSIRNSLIVFGGAIVVGITIIFSNVLPLPPDRYIRVINPFFEVQSPLFYEVAEHAIPSYMSTFFLLSILLPFAGLGIYLILRKGNGKTNCLDFSIRNEMIVFALIFGLVGVYVGATMERLQIFSAISVILLSAIGLAILISMISAMKKNPVFNKKEINLKVVYSLGIIFLLVSPTVFPVEGNWTTQTNGIPTILNGASNLDVPLNDWQEAMNWIKNNTPINSVIVASWDYGYWITTLSERTTISDNAALQNPPHIKKTAELFLSSPDQAFGILEEFDADYVVISLIGNKLERVNEKEYYSLIKGGDPFKINSIIKIANKDIDKFLRDGEAPNEYFWENTLFGKMIPLKPSALLENEESDIEKNNYKILYEKSIKYNSDSTGPLRLVYSSSSFERLDPGPFLAVLVYEVNENYEP